MCKKYGLPVIALVGTVGKGARINYDYGIDAYTSILPMPSSLKMHFQMQRNGFVIVQRVRCVQC